MLTRRGGAVRLEANALVLRPSDLLFLDKLAPLLGDTPRRVKRFVNIVQLVLAIPPELETDDREAVMFCAALNSGAPDTASRVFGCPTPALTLGQVVTPQDQVVWPWLEANPDWQTVPLSRLDVRLALVRRLSFTRPE
jgi:hypothetical protein